MNIQEINNDIISYLGRMIKDDEGYDIYNLSEDDCTEIIHIYLNDWNTGYDIITEYYGNTSTFIPSLAAFVEMMDTIIIQNNHITWDTFMNESNNLIRYCNVFRYYAFHYVDEMNYEDLLECLKEWVQDNIDNIDNIDN